MVFVGSYNQKLHAFNSATGQPIWSAATGGHESSPAVASGLIYIGSAFNNVYAFDAATGQPVWTATTGGPIVSSPAVANGLVYVGSYDYKLHAFEAATGQVVWTAATSPRLRGGNRTGGVDRSHRQRRCILPRGGERSGLCGLGRFQVLRV